MPELNDEQVAFIEADIRRRGVFIRGLQEDLLDHICCLLENRMGHDEPFEKAYSSILVDFGEEGLQGIQDETTYLLTHKYREKMKKLMFGSGLSAAVLLTAGPIFKLQHWPGANVMLLVGILLLALFFVPLWFTLRFRESTERQQKVVHLIGMLAALFLLVPALFKLMHWPLGGMMLLIGFTFFFLVFLPAYLIIGYRNPATRYSTISNSIMLGSCGGLLLLLSFQQPSKNIEDGNKRAAAYSNECLTAAQHDRDALYEQLRKNTADVNALHAAFQKVEASADKLSADIDAAGTMLVDPTVSSKELDASVAELNNALTSVNGFIGSKLAPAALESETSMAAKQKIAQLRQDAVNREIALYQFMAGRYAAIGSETKEK